jgi:hypothetical protein
LRFERDLNERAQLGSPSQSLELSRRRKATFAFESWQSGCNKRVLRQEGAITAPDGVEPGFAASTRATSSLTLVTQTKAMDFWS